MDDNQITDDNILVSYDGNLHNDETNFIQKPSSKHSKSKEKDILYASVIQMPTDARLLLDD